jgi:hypothetical protein
MAFPIEQERNPSMFSIGARQEAGFAILDVRSLPVSVLQAAVMVEAVTTMSRQLSV